MTTRRQLLKAALVGVSAGAAARGAGAQSATPQSPAAPPAAPLFAVEFRTGAKWDSSKPPRDQLHFREHSVNLKRLRDEGVLVVGARYGDKGFIIVTAANEGDVRAEIDKDPTVQAQVFQYEVHAFNVFYPGCLGSARRPG